MVTKLIRPHAPLLHSEPEKARVAAIAFCKLHVVELAQEIIEWQDTGLLRTGGRLRELGRTLAIFETHSLSLAESFAKRAAIEYVVANSKGA